MSDPRITADLLAVLRDKHLASTVLEQLAADTGDSQFRAAAALLRSSPGGRPAIDDDDALLHIADMLQSRAARTLDQAVRAVVHAQGGSTAHCSTASAVARLKRKYRQNFGTKPIM